MDHRKPLATEELDEPIDDARRTRGGRDVVTGTPQVGGVEAEAEPIRSDPTPSTIVASCSMLEPIMSPPPDEFSSTRRTSAGDSARTARIFSTISRVPASVPTPRCDPMCVFTRVAPYDGARCISTMSPFWERDANGSTEAARLIRYEAWMLTGARPASAQ